MFVIYFPLRIVGFPRGNESVDVRLMVTVDHDQQESGGTHSQCDETLFILRIPVFTRQGMVVSGNGRCFTKGHTMGVEIGGSLSRIPGNSHRQSVWTDVILVNIQGDIADQTVRL